MELFHEQVSTSNILLTFIYMMGALSVLLVVLGLGLIDMGLVRARNVLDTWVQKMVAAMIGGVGTLVCGYAIWDLQFAQAFGVASPLSAALKAWWLGGPAASTASVLLDSKLLPEADVLQIFVVFFVTFSMATMALIHSSAIERVQSKALYTMAFFVGLVLSPIVGYLCWGPLSPLTNRGVHDFEGVFPLYIFAGTWSLVLAWRLGPRRGAFGRDPAGIKPTPSNYGLVAAGALLILFALPFVAIGSTFIIPDLGVFGISMTRTGLGLIAINIFAAILAGGIAGALIAYRLQDPRWVFLGPIAGTVMGGTLFDIGTPLQCLAFGAAGPLVACATAQLLRRLGIDEPKVVPLALGPGVAGALLVGFVHWGTPTGGFPELTGDYAVGHAQITPWWQLIGILATMAVAGIPALLLSLVFEKAGALRISSDVEASGIDLASWGVHCCSDDLPLGLQAPSQRQIKTVVSTEVAQAQPAG
ncbi:MULTISPECIES: hypothetical protein [Pseudomonas]|uniref:hypothetical protein n=1 Tax=Pseudomonas TaxID=286 RepID=UPI00257E7118|nr:MULTISPECIES: hypothetical protein [Pseudomonas]